MSRRQDRLKGHRGPERLQIDARDKIGEPLEDFTNKQERRVKDHQAWRCRTCGYKANVGDNCQACGRDEMGREGTRPPIDDIDARAGLRSDVGGTP